MFTIRSSLLKQAALNPKLCQAMIKGYDIEKTSSMGKGTAAHTAILEPDKFASNYILKEPRKGKEFDEIDGKTLILPKTHSELIGMQEEFYSDPNLAEMILNASVIEGEFFAKEDDQFDLVARPDLIYKDVLIDYKTTSRIYNNWLYQAMDAGYDVQFAHYARVLAKEGIKINKWYHITQSTVFPYNIRVFKYDKIFKVRAFESWNIAFEEFKKLYNGTYQFKTDESVVSFSKGNVEEIDEENIDLLEIELKKTVNQ